MTTKTTAPGAQTTDINQFVQKNIVAIVIVLLLIAAGIVGYGFYGQKAMKVNDRLSGMIFDFREKELTDLKDKKLEATAFMTKLRDLQGQVKDYRGLLPVLIQASDFLLSEGKNAEALEVLKMAQSNYNTPYINYLVNIRLAAVYEDLGQLNEAIATLEEVNATGLKFLEDKIYLDLGRLYRKTGDLEKAKMSFQYVVTNMAQDEFKQLARIYLDEMAQKK